jgi:hypothetical protein
MKKSKIKARASPRERSYFLLGNGGNGGNYPKSLTIHYQLPTIVTSHYQAMDF